MPQAYWPLGPSVGPAFGWRAGTRPRGSAGGGGLGRRELRESCAPVRPHPGRGHPVASSLRALRVCERMNATLRFASLHLGCRRERAVAHPVGLVLTETRFPQIFEGRGMTPCLASLLH